MAVFLILPMACRDTSASLALHQVMCFVWVWLRLIRCSEDVAEAAKDQRKRWWVGGRDLMSNEQYKQMRGQLQMVWREEEMSRRLQSARSDAGRLFSLVEAS